MTDTATPALPEVNYPTAQTTSEPAPEAPQQAAPTEPTPVPPLPDAPPAPVEPPAPPPVSEAHAAITEACSKIEEHAGALEDQKHVPGTEPTVLREIKAALNMIRKHL